MSNDVGLAGTEAELMIAGVRSAPGAFTLGTVPGDDSVPVETIRASFAVLAAGVVHAIAAFAWR